jgi:hypothetical protein
MNDDSIFESDSEYGDLDNGPAELITDKCALTLDTTKDPRVDLFYKTTRGLDECRLYSYLHNSWIVNPQDTLRLIFFLRDIRGSGKGEKKLFYQSFRWLINNHPEAVRQSSQHIPFYGSYKDWLEIFLGTRYEKAMLKSLAKQLKLDLSLVTTAFQDDKSSEIKRETKVEIKKKRKGFLSYIWGSSHKTVDTKTDEPKKENEVKTTCESVSLAWKWAPTENTHYDKGKYAGTVSKLCGYMNMSKKEYRKSCSLVRSHLGVVEAFMCGKKWDEIDFSKVPSRAMHIYKKAYHKHQPERFGKYLEDVKMGEAKMNTGVLQPHEIVGEYMGLGGMVDSIKDDVEAQWASFIDGLEKSGVSFDQSISVIDTSGSMWNSDFGTPGKVAYSIGLVLAHFCKGPFHNKWIEFSTNAKFHSFPDGSLYDKLKSIKSINESTNIQSVFDLILSVYDMFKVPNEQQINRIFIITDGMWNNRTSNANLTNFQLIDTKFSAAGYKRPQLIFWNVSGNTPLFPVEYDVPNTSLVSGFSVNLMKIFLKGGNLNPLSFVLEAINDPRYQRIIL